MKQFLRDHGLFSHKCNQTKILSESFLVTYAYLVKTIVLFSQSDEESEYIKRTRFRNGKNKFKNTKSGNINNSKML
jgi:hypothetical protein